MDILRKVFLSYYHDDAQKYKDALISYNNENKIFIDNSVDTGDIDDSKMTDEQIRVKIRDDYIKDTDVFILLCGKNSKHRKHIDWEIHAAMYKSDIKDPIPILVINLPDCKNGVRNNSDEEKQILDKSNSICWTSFNSYAEYKATYPDLPERILKSLANKKSCITLVNWDGLTGIDLNRLISLSYERRSNFEYDDSDPLRRKNGDDE